MVYCFRVESFGFPGVPLVLCFFRKHRICGGGTRFFIGFTEVGKGRENASVPSVGETSNKKIFLRVVMSTRSAEIGEIFRNEKRILFC